jgi:hypothetical protein
MSHKRFLSVSGSADGQIVTEGVKLIRRPVARFSATRALYELTLVEADSH